MKKRVVIDDKSCMLEVFTMKPMDGVYRFGVQAFGRAGKIESYSMRLSEEFLEDFIKNDLDKNYLERVALQVATNHLKDMSP